VLVGGLPEVDKGQDDSKEYDEQSSQKKCNNYPLCRRLVAPQVTAGLPWGVLWREDVVLSTSVLLVLVLNRSWGGHDRHAGLSDEELAEQVIIMALVMVAFRGGGI